MKCQSQKSDMRRSGQRGAISIGTICTILVVAATISLSLKLVPHYIDFRTINSIVEALTPSEVTQASRAEIYAALDKRFPLNSLYDIKARDVIQYERNAKGTVLRVAYERREPLLMNVDVVINFEKEYDFR